MTFHSSTWTGTLSIETHTDAVVYLIGRKVVSLWRGMTLARKLAREAV